MAFTDASARAALRQVFEAAIASADPRQVLARHLPERPRGRVIVLGAGKSAAVMAAAVEAAWPDAPIEGLVVTRYAHGYPTRRIRVLEASHPVPDAAGAKAAAELLEVARGAGGCIGKGHGRYPLEDGVWRSRAEWAIYGEKGSGGPHARHRQGNPDRA